MTNDEFELADEEFHALLREWAKDMSKPIRKKVSDHLLAIAKEQADGDLLYDEKRQAFCLVKHAPKRLLKRARREGGLLIV